MLGYLNSHHIFADGGYRGPKLKEAVGNRWTVQTIMRPKDAEGFVPLRVRWVVEPRFSSWGEAGFE